MIREAIDRLLAISEPKVHAVNGKSYLVTRDGKQEPLASPLSEAEPLEFHSLSGLVDYVASGHDDDARRQDEVVIVGGPGEVRLVAALVGEFRQREVFAVAVPYLSPPFPFGEYIDIETFVTQLQSCFVADEETKKILQVVGNVKQSSVDTLVDDGITQAVVAQRDLTHVGNVLVPNPVTLRPFRTFPEIDQPASKYVLRLRRGEKDAPLPSAALFEVGDCRWKHEAVDRIRKRLGELLDAAGSAAQVFA